MGAHCAGEYSSPFEIDFSPSLVAEVTNPRKFGLEAKRAIRGKVGSYVLYSLVTRTAVTSEDGFVTAGELVNEVDRRYSDFDWLTHTLAKRYAGLFVGTMPEKRLMDSNADAIIQERLSGLTDFMNEILQNPYLEDDITVKNFLSMNKDVFDAYKEELEVDRSQLMLKCPGLAEWESFLESLKQNRNSEAALGTLKAEFTDQVKHMTKVLYGTNDAHSACEKMLSAADKFGQAAQAIVELNGDMDNTLDNTFGSPSELDAVKNSINGASRILQHAAKAVHESTHIRMSNANSFSIMGTGAKRDRLTMLTFLDILKQREQLRKKHEQKRQDRTRKDLQYKTLKKNGRFEDAQKLEQLLDAIKIELDAETEGMASQAKGLLASELRRYSNHRFFEFRRRTAYFANEQVREADQAIEHWQTLLRTLHVDQEHMSDLAENSLLHGRIETLGYNVDPYSDSTHDGPVEQVAEAEEGDEEVSGEYEEGSGEYEEGSGEYEEVEEEDDEEGMGLDDDQYEDDESQEDEL